MNHQKLKYRFVSSPEFQAGYRNLTLFKTGEFEFRDAVFCGTMSHLFLGANHAALYAKFRPTSPQIVVDKIVSYLSEKVDARSLDAAADVGCGSGQSSRILSPYFRKVTGTDVSENQLVEARQHPENPLNVVFEKSTAEALEPFAADSLHLVSAGQSFHWFDPEKFFESVRRVLKPNGVVAIYGYLLPFIQGSSQEASKRLEKLTLRYHYEDIGQYWDQRRQLIMSKYEGVALPFEDFVRDDAIFVRKEIPFKDYLGYLRTWSAYQTLVEREGQDAGDDVIRKFRKELLRELGKDERDEGDFRISVSIQYFLLMARK